ncbi:MAG: ATP-binding protein [Myxococcota bacterium]
MDADFQLLFEKAPGLYLVLDPGLNIVAVSDAYLAATMTEREKILGRHLFDVFPDNPAELKATGTTNLRASLIRVLAEHRPDAMAVQRYDVREAGSGAFQYRYWSPLNSPVFGPDGALAYIIHRVEDVTELMRLTGQAGEDTRKEAEVLKRAQQIQDVNQELRQKSAELEYQLRQAQKLEAVGRLAGGIAHDFNNLLSVVLTVSALLIDDERLAPELRPEIEEIERAGDRAATLTRQLLAFSRQQVLEPRVLQLNALIGDLHKMLSRILGEHIQIRQRLAPDLGKILADPSQLEQVVMNLIVNARDAMPRGGTLTIETANVDIDEAYAESHIEVRPGRYIQLTVSDTGMGMTPEVMEKIFDPFFTTKKKGEGTGLGLATVFGIVKQSGGHIWAYSEVGHGTTFKIYMPRTDAPATASTAPGTYKAQGNETILLVEDDPSVRAAAKRILVRSGYQVLEAANPARALEVFKEHQATVDLVLTDVIMPGMSGRQLWDLLVEIKPGTKVLFMSGYTENTALDDDEAPLAGFNFIQKPLTPRALTQKIREVLEG